MNNTISFNTVTPQVKFAQLSDENTDEKTQQVSFKHFRFSYPEALKDSKKKINQNIKNYYKKHPLQFIGMKITNLIEKVKSELETRKMFKNMFNVSVREVKCYSKKHPINFENNPNDNLTFSQLLEKFLNFK